MLFYKQIYVFICLFIFYLCGVHRIACRSHFSPSTAWILGTETMFPGLAFTYLAKPFLFLVIL